MIQKKSMVTTSYISPNSRKIIEFGEL